MGEEYKCSTDGRSDSPKSIEKNCQDLGHTLAMACYNSRPNDNDWIVNSMYCEDGQNKPPYSDYQLEVLNMCVEPYTQGSTRYLQSPCIFKNVYRSIAEDDPLQKKFGCAVNCYDDIFAKEKGEGQIDINRWWTKNCVPRCDKNPGEPGNAGVDDDASADKNDSDTTSDAGIVLIT